ncbi:MAG: glycosyltransferase family 2 protein [Patescibacteria group bacterium]|nr:glycosyltransferase family 2 protein [Patescibacteria group bacterium]
MDISVIIVNYKNKEKVGKCLAALSRADWGDLTREIIVVDNDSREDLSSLAEVYPEVKIIRSEKNLGMGGGNNLGAQNSAGDFILILNPDTAVQDDAILKLHRHLAENNSAGIVGPKLLNPDGSLQYSCLRFPKIHTPILRRTFFGGLSPRHLDDFLMKDYDHAATKSVDWLMGSCFLIRREILEKDGHIFDEKFFMYFEDTDLCRRVKAEHNYQVVYLPTAVVVHDHARQSAEKPWYIAPLVDSLTREHIKSWARYFFG